MFTATSLILKVRGDGILIHKPTVGLQYIPVYEYWLSQNASIGDASGGTAILLTTRGLIIDLVALPYECVFSNAFGGVAVSLPVSPLSPSELLCVTPDWGRKNIAGPTSVSLINRVRGLVVPFRGTQESNAFQFTASWARVQEHYIAASGGHLSIIGVGLHTLSAYRCLLESNDSKRMVSNLAHPTSPSTVSCQIDAWGFFHEAAMVNVTLMDGYGLHVFFSGLPVLRQVEIRESWLSVRPTYFWANAPMTVTVTGFGFHPQRLYNCTLTWKAVGFWATLYNPEKWAPGESVLEQQIRTVPSSPVDNQELVCNLPQWGSLYAARTAILSVTTAGIEAREVTFVGEDAVATNIFMDPIWESITPARYGWVGLGAITGLVYTHTYTYTDICNQYIHMYKSQNMRICLIMYNKMLMFCVVQCEVLASTIHSDGMHVNGTTPSSVFGRSCLCLLTRLILFATPRISSSTKIYPRPLF